MKTILVWFREDLRITDNPALFAAANEGRVFPIYILDEVNALPLGQASRVWLHHSLHALNASLGNKLNVYEGNSYEVLASLIKKHGVMGVYWNRCYEPEQRDMGATLKAKLSIEGIEAKSFNGSLLWEPSLVKKADDSPYKVFTPFYRAALSLPIRPPLPCPKDIKLIKDEDNKNTINHLRLLPSLDWHKPLAALWQMGEKAAQKKLDYFIDNQLAGYEEGRDYPAKNHCSRLSPHLHFGEISPHQVWEKIAYRAFKKRLLKDSEKFKKELAWREFSYYLLYHFPKLPTANFQSHFDDFPWCYDKTSLKAWQRGQTGYPIVDAGMRELWQTGYMHNRIRMITASFLVKNLLIHWHEGERWFFDCLLDADLANNSASWQWVAGSGADAAPYFRIFNPLRQSEQFDSNGDYIKKFVPELAALPTPFLFAPWRAPKKVLEQAGIILGTTYPHPIIDLDISRERALSAFHTLKREKSSR